MLGFQLCPTPHPLISFPCSLLGMEGICSTLDVLGHNSNMQVVFKYIDITVAQTRLNQTFSILF